MAFRLLLFPCILAVIFIQVTNGGTSDDYLQLIQSRLPQLNSKSLSYRHALSFYPASNSPLAFQKQSELSDNTQLLDNIQLLEYHEIRHLNGRKYLVVDQHSVDIPGADWLRLYFDPRLTRLSFAVGDGSDDAMIMILLTSNGDRAEQWLSAVNLREHWQYSSAYFNGQSVSVKLLVDINGITDDFEHQQISPVKLLLSHVEYSNNDQARYQRPTSLCGRVDRRELSYYNRSARLMPIGCTAWMIDDQNSCFLSAGHCKPRPGMKQMVLQFHVPLSFPNGTVRHPEPRHQYPVDMTSMQFPKVVPGNDWMYFGAFPNSNTGQTPFQTEKDRYTIIKNPTAADIPPVNSTLEIIGYGSTFNPFRVKSQVQQVHQGPLTGQSYRKPIEYGGVVSAETWSLEYRVDTTGGNSGSAVTNVDTGEAIAIHAYAGCDLWSDSANSGTFLGQRDLQRALRSPKGVCKPTAI